LIIESSFQSRTNHAFVDSIELRAFSEAVNADERSNANAILTDSTQNRATIGSIFFMVFIYRLKEFYLNSRRVEVLFG
jgi:hypothetical protein